MDDKINRRDFMKQAAKSAGAVAVTLALAGTATKPLWASSVPGNRRKNGEYDWTKHEYIYLVNTRKCIGCGACVRACIEENNVPEHHYRTWVERYMISRTGDVRVDSPEGGKDGFERVVSGFDITKGFFVPKLCNQCRHAPCVQLCPVGASYYTKDGVVLVDEKHCIGCGYCVQGCPYGARFIYKPRGVASKCTFCYHRITKGLLPACVQACPAGARMFGDRKRPGDKVADIIAKERIHVLKPDILTEPNCFYLGHDKEVS